MINNPMNYTTFIMLIGPSASGKSKFAAAVSKYGYVWISSDKIREQLYGDENIQGDPQEVFDTMREITLGHIFKGNDVIYDATNMSLKSRRTILNHLPIRTNKFAVVFASDFKTLMKQNAQRERKVPQEVIEGQIKQFEMPTRAEGFDGIKLFRNGDRYDPTEVLFKMMEFDQDNPHHNLTLGRHCLKTAQLAYEGDDEYWFENAALFHDFGKMYTKTYVDIKGNTGSFARYYNHHNVGAYYSLLFEFPLYESDDEYIKMAQVINYHMVPFFVETKKAVDRWRARLGEYLWEAVLRLHEADKLAAKGD